MKQTQFEKRFHDATEACVTMAEISDCNVRVFVGLGNDTRQQLEPLLNVLKQQLSDKMLRFLKSEARRLYFILKIFPLKDRREVLYNMLVGKVDAVEVEAQAVEAEREDMPQMLASAFRVPKPQLIEVMGIGLYVLDYETLVLNLLHGYHPSIRSTTQLGQKGQFYIVTGQGDAARYLHSDGSLRECIDERNNVFGYFTSEKDAQEVIRQSI